MSRCEAATNARKSTTIGGLPNDILGRLLEKMPIQDAAKTSILSKKWIQIRSTLPYLVFDHLFFQYVSDIGAYVSDIGASAASIIHKFLMQDTGNILGFHLISIIENQKTLNLPVLEILVLRFCADVDSVNLVSPNLDSMSILSIYTITFGCFNVNPIFAVIKHLCLNGTSLEKLGSVRVPDRLRRLLKLQSLKLCYFKISVESIRCAFCLLRNSSNLYKIEIHEVVKVKVVYLDPSGEIRLLRIKCVDLFYKFYLFSVFVIVPFLVGFALAYVSRSIVDDKMYAFDIG
ncbi:putative FBD-associated F-box protein-like [Capsicum annuum]|nr:putative FBD-associated F-box protein-like [Capsicum annuum]KAF3613247.1 putative FBD-associated F-box protein-like [Capsicum annuum]